MSDLVAIIGLFGFGVISGMFILNCIYESREFRRGFRHGYDIGTTHSDMARANLTECLTDDAIETRFYYPVKVNYPPRSKP